MMLRPAAIAGLATAALLMTAPVVRAQAVEVGLFAGLGFGGSFISPGAFEGAPLEAGVVYGGAVAVEFLPGWRFEAQVMRQESGVHGAAHGTHLDVDVDRYMAGIQQQERLSPGFDIFGEFMLGATRFAPEGFDSELWFTLGAGAGVKTLVTPNVGFRFEARGYYTPISISGRVYCGLNSCLVGYTGAGTFQGDISAGVIVVF